MELSPKFERVWDKEDLEAKVGKSACCREIFSASSAVAPGERGVPDEVSGANGPFGHHTPRVRFNEDYLPQAATIYAASDLNWLANHSR